jgi:hypothetical protein
MVYFQQEFIKINIADPQRPADPVEKSIAQVETQI